MKKGVIAMLALVALIAAGCSQPIEKEDAGEKEQANMVRMEGFAFSPAEIKVTAGSSVTWINDDSAPHTVKFDEFESEKISRGGKYSHTFTEAGEYAYICGIHSSMKGKVVVQ